MSGGGAQSASVCLTGFLVAVTGWIGTCVASGLAQWRVSQQDDGATEAVWVGIWRACVLGSASAVRLRCYHFQLSTAPPEVIAGQVLMTLSMLTGVAAKVVSTAALRFIFFGADDAGATSHACALAGGTLFCCASLVAAVPLAWHARAVNARQDVLLPTELADRDPRLSREQIHGAAIYLGFCSALLMFAGGVAVASYYRTVRQRLKVHPCFGDGRLSRPSLASLFSLSRPGGPMRSRPGSARGSPPTPPKSAAERAAAAPGDRERVSLHMSPLGGKDGREPTVAGNSAGSTGNPNGAERTGRDGEQPGRVSPRNPDGREQGSSRVTELSRERGKVASPEPEWVGVG